MTDATPGMDAYVSEGVQNHPKASHNSSSSCRRPIDASRGGALKVSEVLDVLDDPERIATRRLLRDTFDEEEEEEKEEDEEKEEETTRRPKLFAGMTTRFCVLLLARDALWHKR